MTATALTVKIANIAYDVLDGSLSISDRIEQRTTCSFTVVDLKAAFSFKYGQTVVVADTLEGTLFNGNIHTITRHTDTGTVIYYTIQCNDISAVLDRLTSNKQYTSQYAGAVVVDQVKGLGPLGILTNYAIDVDDTQADFGAGTLTGTLATNNVEDGNLELAPAGTKSVITENTTSIFSSGTLNGVTSASNMLSPTATSAIKLVGTESLVSDSNAYTYLKIYSSGSITIISGRYLSYDIWIDPASPEIRAGVDITFTDGSTLRDLSQTYVYHDVQNLLAHPNQNLDGFASGQWYHRKFLLDNFNGKTISYVAVAIEGDKGGKYTVYFKNILEVDAADAVVNTFFSGSLNVNPPRQMQNSGYSKVSCTVVSTYDCTTANRVSPSYNIDQVKIVKDSFISWKANTPINPLIPDQFTNTNVKVEYSLNGGNSYIKCTNNAALPNLIAGLSVSGKTITFRQTFEQLDKVSPEAKPILTSLVCTLNPSYTASKSDVTLSATTTGEWAAGTLTNTQAPATILKLLGGIRDWTTADISNMTIFGNGASGPSVTTVRQHCNFKNFWIELAVGLEGRSQLNWLGQFQNAVVECDVYIDVSYGKVGIVYRTTGWSNYDGTFAYGVEVTTTSIKLFRGSNNGGASANFAVVQVGATGTIAVSTGTWHKLTVLFNGSTHQISLDDIMYVNTTDSTYTATGYVGLRTSNSSGTFGYQGQFNNFGLAPIGLSGTWTSASTSLTSASTYLNSAVTWQDVSLGDQTTSILVESTINGGSSFQTVTNGGAIPNLTLAQSLSGVNVQFRITLTTASAASAPQIQYFVCRVLGGFSSSGTRISKALSLSSVGTCGSTLVFWNAITPTNTSVVVATSLDGSSYSNVLSGGAITGLTAQPAPTIDSFNLLSGGGYTSTFGNGGSVGTWIWDTTNSRLTITGASLALLLYGAISTSNVEIICDLDRADIGGVAFRSSNTSNYYAVVANDASSSNTPNKLVLERMSGGTRTFPTQGNIVFTRGDKHRIRVTMVAGLITAYFDGVQIFQYTDGSPLAAGQCGLVHDLGTSQFYNLRIQPYGDDLTGKQVFTKITLTSTDPTVTPQVADFTTLVTNPNIGAGAVVPSAAYLNTYISDNIKDLTKRSDYYSNVKPDGSFIFTDRKTVPSPWIITSNDMLNGVTVDDVADLYRNRQVITGVFDTLNVNETKIGDSVATSWTLQYSVSSMSSMSLNGQSVTFGQKSIDTGKNFYYEIGSNSIAADTATTLLISTDSLYIAYVAQYETSIVSDNTGQYPNTTSQKDYINQSGLSVSSNVLLNQASAAKTASGNADDIDVSLYRLMALDINITAVSGTSPTITFFIERKDAGGNYNIIYQTSSINSVSTVSRTIGRLGQTQESLGTLVRLRWNITGTSPSFTFNASIIAQVDAGLAGIGVITAIEDVKGQNINIPGANALASGLLQKWGVIGRTMKFKTKRTGLASGQYAPVFNPELLINDASMLITSVTRTAAFKKDSGSPSQSYLFDVEASEGPTLSSWQKAMNDAGVT